MVPAPIISLSALPADGRRALVYAPFSRNVLCPSNNLILVLTLILILCCLRSPSSA